MTRARRYQIAKACSHAATTPKKPLSLRDVGERLGGAVFVLGVVALLVGGLAVAS